MIYQLHHEDVFTGKIEFVAQNEIEDTVDQLIFDAWFHEWFAGVRSRHPLPENCRWFVCREGAPQFMVASNHSPKTVFRTSKDDLSI